MKTLYLVKSNPVAGKESEFHEWYENTHLDEVLQISGFKSAQRFALDENQMQAEQAHSHVAIYEIESEDVAGTLKNLRAATWLKMTDAMDFATLEVTVLNSLSAKRSVAT